jgi:hypothetical protein
MITLPTRSGWARAMAVADGRFDQGHLTAACLTTHLYSSFLLPRGIEAPVPSTDAGPHAIGTLATTLPSDYRPLSSLRLRRSRPLQWRYLEMRGDSIAWTVGGRRPPMFLHCCSGRFRQARQAWQACLPGLMLTCGKP